MCKITELQQVIEKIKQLTEPAWDTSKKAKAINGLSDERVQKLKHLDGDLFATTLEEMLSPGRADCSVAEPPPDVCEFAERAWGMPAWELDKPGFVELPVPFGRFGPQIYVRACYLALWAWIKEQQNQPGSPFRGCVITGNPGIGKSYFLAFVLTMLLQQMQRVLWQAQFTAKEQYWWLFEDGGVTELTPTDARRVLQRGGVYYLSDGTNPAIDGNMKPILALVAHLPDAAAYKQVMRQVEGVQASPVVLPPWETVDELLNLQPLHPSISREQVEERFRKRGGVPRTVFERSKGVLNPLRGDLRSALGDLQFGALLHANDAIDGFSAQASHQLIMLNVPKWREGDWETYEVNITSPWIAELIWDRSIKQAGAFANTFALMTNDITKGFNAFVGDLWEAAWHKVPAALPDKMYTIRELLPKAPVKRGPKPAGYKPPAQTPVQDIDSKRCFHFFANQFATFAALDYIPNLDLEPNMYIRPLWGNLPGVASFRLKGELFQLTRSSSKPAMTDALLKVLAMLPDNAVPELYIVVPNRTIFDAWVVSITLPTWEGAAQATRDFVLERNAKDKVVQMLNDMRQYVMLGWEDMEETLQALSRQLPTQPLREIPLPPTQPSMHSSSLSSSPLSSGDSTGGGASGRQTRPQCLPVG